MDQFEARLQEIKNQRDLASSARVHWGDIAARYPRLEKENHLHRGSRAASDKLGRASSRAEMAYKFKITL